MFDSKSPVMKAVGYTIIRFFALIIIISFGMPDFMSRIGMDNSIIALVNGQKVVLHGTVADNTPKAVQDKFKQRGYEVDGAVQPVKKILECRTAEENFQSKEGQQQDARQLR